MIADTHGAKGTPWIGFDLDGTLAEYHGWRGIMHIGKPIQRIGDLAKRLHSDGKEIRIVTARVAPGEDPVKTILARAIIASWCRENLGFVPPITHEKDALMETLYDDRVHAVEQNTGRVLNRILGDKHIALNSPYKGDPYRCPRCGDYGFDGGLCRKCGFNNPSNKRENRSNKIARQHIARGKDKDVYSVVNRPGLGPVDVLRGDRGDHDCNHGSGAAKIRRKHKDYSFEDIVKILLRGDIYTTYVGNKKGSPENGKAVILGTRLIFLSRASNGHWQVDTIYDSKTKCQKVIEAAS